MRDFYDTALRTRRPVDELNCFGIGTYLRSKKHFRNLRFKNIQGRFVNLQTLSRKKFQFLT